MQSYVITYGKGNGLFAEYVTIQGKDAKDALYNHYGKKYKRVTGDESRYSDVILTKGYYDKSKNVISYSGRFQRLCYIESEV